MAGGGPFDAGVIDYGQHAFCQCPQAWWGVVPPQREHGERDVEDALVEVASWPRSVNRRLHLLALAGEPVRP